MDRSFLIRTFGYRAAFLHGDPMVQDRWRWIKRRLPITRNGELLLDAGCGTGAMTIAAAKRGYHAIGLSWDDRNQRTAAERARIAGVPDVEFPIQDLRSLDGRNDMGERFDFVLSMENIEHISDDRKLMRDLAAVIKPGGWLLMSTPNYHYRAADPRDRGPFSTYEDGWHVRRGYTAAMLRELAADAGLMIEEISSCSGWTSQRLTSIMRAGGLAGWAAILPFRWLPRFLDRAIRRVFDYPDFSICMVCYKPRFAGERRAAA